jgi:hypothetical protein
MQYRRRVYTLADEENEEDIPYTEEEEQLFQIEAEAEEGDPEWYAQYKEEVARFEEEESGEGESKNGQ